MSGEGTERSGGELGFVRRELDVLVAIRSDWSEIDARDYERLIARERELLGLTTPVAS